MRTTTSTATNTLISTLINSTTLRTHSQNEVTR